MDTLRSGKRGTVTVHNNKILPRDLERQSFEETISLAVLMAVLRTNDGPQFWLGSSGKWEKGQSREDYPLAWRG